MVKVLLVDDSLFERRAIANILKKNGYSDVVEAKDSNEALLKCGVEEPDIVVLDLRMPGEDGLYVLDRLRKIDPEVKVVIASIIRDQQTIDDCIARGACDYISKPITEKKVLDSVNKVLHENAKHKDSSG